MTKNNHGSTREVLFTSSLSYLLNPSCDHGLGDIFLKKFLEQLGIPSAKKVKYVTVNSEYPLGKSYGNIDIFIETDAIIIGVEAKIWDNSAVNNSKNNDAQLNRYSKALKRLSVEKKKNWMLVFLIPYKDAPKCIEEFEKIREYGTEHVKLLVWYPDEKNNKSEYDEFYIKNSIYEIIKSIISNPLIDIQDRTSWLLKSLIESIPEFAEKEISESRFPTKDDLKNNCSNLWKNLIEPFCKVLKGKVNPRHTSIGFPYGTPPDKSEHGNTLFRIRTTQSYYKNISDKKDNLLDSLQIEIWEDVYKKIKDWEDWNKWLKDLSLSNQDIINGTHLDEKGNEKIKLLIISSEKKMDKEKVEKFNEIMKKGFNEIL